MSGNHKYIKREGDDVYVYPEPRIMDVTILHGEKDTPWQYSETPSKWPCEDGYATIEELCTDLKADCYWDRRGVHPGNPSDLGVWVRCPSHGE